MEVGRLDYPMVGEFKFFKAGARPSVLVRLTDEDGVAGLGPGGAGRDLDLRNAGEAWRATLRHYLAEAVLGADPADLDDVHARMERAIRPSFSVGQPLAKAAIDLACHDLWGKQVGRSRYVAFSGSAASRKFS